MIRCLTRNQLDAAAYDQCIARSPDRIIYAFSWYLDTVSPGWECLILGDYEAVMPLPTRRRYGMKVVMQPLFCHQLGVFSASLPIDEPVFRSFLQALRKQIPYVASYQVHAANARLPMPDFCLRQPMTNHVLNLRATYPELLANYTHGRRYDLKRAQKQTDWALTESDDVGPLFDVFLQHNTGGIGRIHPAAGPMLQRLVAVLKERGKGRLQVATRQGEIMAGSLLLTDDNRIIHLFCAATPGGRRTGVRTLILDEAIRQHAGRAMLLDFESPEAESLARFNQSFGAEAEPYARLSYNDLPGPVRWLHHLKKRLHLTLRPR